MFVSLSFCLVWEQSWLYSDLILGFIIKYYSLLDVLGSHMWDWGSKETGELIPILSSAHSITFKI